MLLSLVDIPPAERQERQKAELIVWPGWVQGAGSRRQSAAQKSQTVYDAAAADAAAAAAAQVPESRRAC